MQKKSFSGKYLLKQLKQTNCLQQNLEFFYSFIKTV